MMKLIKNLDYFNTLRSMSVSTKEVFLVDMDEGDLIYRTDRSGNIVESYTGMGLAIADRCVLCDDGSVHCYGQIRDFVEGECAFKESLIVRDKKLRHLCFHRDATRKYVPGEIIPIIPRGYLVVPDFNMSGTNWFLLPIKVARTLTIGNYDGLKEAIEAYDEIWEEA